MWPDRVSNPGPLTYESGALPIALRGPANGLRTMTMNILLSTQTTLTEFTQTIFKLSLLNISARQHWRHNLPVKSNFIR